MGLSVGHPCISVTVWIAPGFLTHVLLSLVSDFSAHAANSLAYLMLTSFLKHWMFGIFDLVFFQCHSWLCEVLCSSRYCLSGCRNFYTPSKSQLMWDISYRWKSSIFRSTIAKGILHPLEKIPGSTECQAPTTGILTMRVCIHFSTFPNSSLSLSPALCLQVLASGTIFGQTQAKKQKSLNPSKSLSSIFYPILFCISLLLPWYKSSQ